MTKRKFYQRIVTVEVLSEDPIDDLWGLEALAREISYGDFSGKVEWGPLEAVDGKKMATLLLDQGSSPEFFNIDENGNDVDVG